MANEEVLETHPDKIAKAEEILGYEFKDKPLLGAAITHPSALDKEKTLYDYERLEFLGDSILGAITAMYLFTQYRDLDEGGLTRIKVSLVSGKSLSRVAYDEGIADCIIFGESEAGTDKRGLPSALENVYESLGALPGWRHGRSLRVGVPFAAHARRSQPRLGAGKPQVIAAGAPARRGQAAALQDHRL